ncbi:CBS domain-containing protein [Streptomyces sp. BR123]|jgi:CBS-domain-containing membrane protein|uniref:CBS domain-containing protein n=1 Tax=Streptomyces sp. BR123 TaxID=2749828 RepID=UPI0015C44F91|nr:CBS domain-containing protein [Streptomyces sp. BR123]NXY97518.1 CBS domain-containing protein [Streptomyces sp. BR123]
MRHCSVAELMTPTAISAQRGTAFKEIARLLDEFGITALPVVDESERPVGVVSEADLLRRRASGSGANTAAELMTSPAVTARPEWSAVRAARVMERHGVKRLPVVDSAGRLVGVLSRSDLLRLFLRRDRAIQEEILEDVLTRTLLLSPSAVTVEVEDGLVTLSGTVQRRSLVPIVLRLCRSVDGVVDVINRLRFEQDDMTADAPSAADQLRRDR